MGIGCGQGAEARLLILRSGSLRGPHLGKGCTNPVLLNFAGTHGRSYGLNHLGLVEFVSLHLPLQLVSYVGGLHAN